MLRLFGANCRSGPSLFVLMLIVLSTPPAIASRQSNKMDDQFTRDFRLEACTFSSSGRNPYFILEPGYRTVFRGAEDGETVVNTITVTGRTRRIGGIETRVVEERETHNGELAEVSRNFFAICDETNSVFYFGEEVDLYAGGVIIGHEEVAPDVGLDRAEITAMGQVVETPAGTFEGCIEMQETTPLEPKALEFKRYAPDIGLVQDDTLLLVQYGFVR